MLQFITQALFPHSYEKVWYHIPQIQKMIVVFCRRGHIHVWIYTHIHVCVGNWVFDMQILLSNMQKSCPRCKVFASRVAKPECRTTIFTGRPHRLLFYYFTISFPFGSRQKVFASRVAKPECRTTIFTGRPAVFASRVAKPECRTTIFTSRPDAFSRVFFASRTAFLCMSAHVFACRPNVSRLVKMVVRHSGFATRDAKTFCLEPNGNEMYVYMYVFVCNVM